VTATLSDLLGESVHLEADLGARDLFVRVDPVEIERVVLNLCLNARDAMPGGGTIFVSVTPLPLLRVEPELPQGWVCLSVRDQGVGLTAEVRERMFEPFYTTKADPTGAGLGLASVHGVVGQSDGRVEVDSAPDQGTEIRVLLPRIEAPAAEVTTAAPVDVRPGEALRVLLVEDQPEVRRAVASLLRGLGHWPVEAEGGQEALDRLAADPAGVDLVLTDVMMPGMDGLELGERLGELHPDLPLVYMSGYVDRVDRAPEAAFLAKPFTVGELRGALEAARRRPTGV